MSSTPRIDKPSPHPRDVIGDVLAIVGAVISESKGGGFPRAVTEDCQLVTELGVDSLSRLEIARRLRSKLGVSLPESVILGAETPRQLATAAEAVLARGGDKPSFSPKRGFEIAAASFELPHRARTLVEALEWHCERHPDRTHVHLVDESGDSAPHSYADLVRGARAVAAGLLNYQLGGKPIGIMLPTGLDFLHCFFGVMLAGGVPVPLYPPFNLGRLEDHMKRQISILRNCGAAGLVLLKEGKSLAPLLRAALPGLRLVAPPDEIAMSDALPPVRPLGNDDLAFLQYTSGSTGTPKGVMLTHDNVLANLRAIGAVLKPQPADVCVSWLPLYHDMGLIGAWLGSLYHGCPIVLMSPLHFLAGPERWLRAISDYRGTISAAPNFAYQLCASKLDDASLEGIDLSTWRVALNGAEPVSAKALEAFSARFERYGFSRAAMTPVYGLAENALAVTFPPIGRGPRLDVVKRGAMQSSRRAVETATEDPDATTVVSCGMPLPGHDVRIVDAAGFDAADREIGKVQFRGPSACRGYFGNDEASARLRSGEWLYSGDFGYVSGGELFIVGREKDLIIKAGRNIYPHEIEDAVSELPGVRKGGVAAFAAQEGASGTENLVIACETATKDSCQRDALLRSINEVCADVAGVTPDEVLLVRPRSLPKTSSGKIRRSTCAQLHAAGRLEEAQRIYIQIARLAVAALPGLAGRWASSVRRFAFAAWFWIAACVLSAGACVAVLLSPGVKTARLSARLFARALLRACGLPVSVRGLELSPHGGAKIAVANHASYFDSVLLTAVLPVEFSFVAKKDLESHWLLGLFLRKLGVLFVDRIDARQGITDLESIFDRLSRGESLVFFPEGTFCRSVGLLPFKMGAFSIAARAGREVVPIVISGTRFLLRSDQWLPRWQELSVVALPPLEAESGSWEDTVRLRDEARAAILRAAGEPDLALHT